MRFDEFNKFFIGNVARNRLLNTGFPDVQVDFVRPSTHITEIGVGHFTGAIDEAAHNRNFDTLQMPGVGFDVRGGGLKVKKGAASGGSR